MLQQPESAVFLIADISGYTRFLDAVELDHAHDIMADLMGAVVKALRPPFKLAKLEGDAAFLYAPGEKMDGSMLRDALDSAYFTFRKRLRTLKLANSCECSACRRMQMLDLKFVCHHGEAVKHKVAGREELVGRDVIVVHRLLKNEAGERLSDHAYALFTEACVRATGIDPVAQGLVGHGETIDIIGEVTCWLADLEQAWRDENDRARSEVTSAKAAATLTFEIAAPRPTVWEHFNMPEHRPKWRAADEVRETTQNGRRGAGTVNHCMHGDHVILEEVVDWRPFDYLTLTTLLPMPDAPKVVMTYAFLETPTGGTRIEIRVAKPKPKDQAFLDEVAPRFAQTITSEVGVLRQMLEVAGSEPDLIEEPEPAAPGKRFAREPVRPG
jgi:uncharacterized protein YndB with AHSA1/START domain